MKPTTKQKHVMHGLSRVPEYRTWIGMKQRCYNPKSSQWYYLYGGRGIKVCDRWLNNFGNFYADMGQRPSLTHSLDRINPDRNYTPSNCRWATPLQQTLNRRVNKTNKSGHPGVHFVKSREKWLASITINYRSTHIGIFDTRKEAIVARLLAEKIYDRLNREL